MSHDYTKQCDVCGDYYNIDCSICPLCARMVAKTPDVDKWIVKVVKHHIKLHEARNTHTKNLEYDE